jgi:tetratricopeptide (TPR) repeat protein
MAKNSDAAFISYRRETGQIVATALFQGLTGLGVDAFLDAEHIRSGMFDEAILAQIEARPYFLLILTPGTLRRCRQKNDWVLREIDHALATKTTIVPVRSARFDLSEMERFLPAQTWMSLRRFNAVSVPDELSSSWIRRFRREFLPPLQLGTGRVSAEHAAAAGRIAQDARRQPAVTANALAAQARFEEGEMLYDEGNTEAALVRYTAAIRLKPDFAEAFYSRGCAYSGSGDHGQAINDFSEAMRLMPRMQEAFNARASSYYAQKDNQRALADFGEAIRLNPDYAQAFKNRSLVYRDMKNYDRALADLDNAGRLDPENAEIRFGRALVHFYRKDPGRAADDLTSAIRLNPSYAEAFFWRGTVRSSQGDHNGAIADWQRARELDPDSPWEAMFIDTPPPRQSWLRRRRR